MTPLALLVTRLMSDISFGETTPPTPSPYPAFTGDPNQVTPGAIGFAITFAVVIATVLLVIDMTRRVRRVRYRAEIAEKLDAEQAEQGEGTPGATPAP